MALTKVTLIADSTISDVHINNLTTDALIEGNKLFYTNDRVASYLAANNFATTGAGYFYDATLSANILTFSKSDGTTDSVDLSLYLDDTNLARLVSGTLDGLTGIATFTRDDSSTFTVDFSSFLADANDYVSSGSFDTSTGVITLTRQSGATVTFDLDGKYAEAAHTHDDRYYTELESDGRFAPISHTHLWSHITDRPTALSAFTNDLGNYGGFLTSFTETDPIYTASSWYTTQNNSANWDAAYGWGNHAGLYSLLGHTHDYLPIGGKAADSELLDGIDSSQFVRNDTSRSQVSNYMDIANVTSGSFRIYDGTTFRGGFGTSRWSDSVSAVDQMSIYSVGDGINFYTGNSSAIRAVINSDYLYHVSDVRSPLFYDSDNTGYYVNPSSTSVMATVSAGVLNGTDIYTTGGWFRNHTNSNGIYWSATGWHLFPHNDSDFRIHSGNGTNVSLRMETNGTTRGYIYAENDNTIGFLSNSRSWSFRTYSDGNALVYGYLTANSSLRAPIFYDSDNTGYYVDPASTSKIIKLWINNGGANGVSWASGLNMGDSSNYWNLIQDAGIARQRNYGTGGYDWFNNTASTQIMLLNNGGSLSTTGDMRSPIFYDSNDTTYYLDPSSTGISLKTAGSVISNGAFGTNGYGGGNLVGRVYGPRGATYSSGVASVTGAIKIRLPIRSNDTMWSMKVRVYNYSSNNVSEYLIGNYSYSAGAWNYGATYFGTSNSTPRTVRFGNDGSYDCVWIGETSTTWSHPVVSVMDFMGGYANGNVENWDDNWSVTFVTYFDTVAASIAPDINFNSVGSYYLQNNYSVNTDHQYGVYFDNGRSSAYAIYREGGAWSHPYPDLRIAFHTGIKLGANSGYNGIRFYTDYDMSTQVMSVNNGSDPLGGGHVYVNNTLQAGEGLRAPVFYDSNDTYYFVDPASDSRQNNITANRIGVNPSGSNSSRYGISLYGGYSGGEPTYGMLFTGTSLGTHGSVTGDWATYFTMNDSSSRGWIFRRVGSENVASISGGGSACFNGEVSANSNVTSYGDVRSFGCGVYHCGPTTSWGLLASYGVSGNYFGDLYSMSTITGINIYPYTGENFVYDTCNGALYIGGTIYQNYYSDCKYKENITVIESALDKIDGIRGVEFDWNALGQEEIYKSGHEVGFIAQEVQAVYPQAVREVHKEREDKIVSALVIDQEKLIPLLLQGIKELKSEIKALKEYLNIS